MRTSQFFVTLSVISTLFTNSNSKNFNISSDNQIKKNDFSVRPTLIIKRALNENKVSISIVNKYHLFILCVGFKFWVHPFYHVFLSVNETMMVFQKQWSVLSICQMKIRTAILNAQNDKHNLQFTVVNIAI
jgi:hypothetical protein